jgi:hypothetical protein
MRLGKNNWTPGCGRDCLTWLEADGGLIGPVLLADDIEPDDDR